MSNRKRPVGSPWLRYIVESHEAKGGGGAVTETRALSLSLPGFESTTPSGGAMVAVLVTVVWAWADMPVNRPITADATSNADKKPARRHADALR